MSTAVTLVARGRFMHEDCRVAELRLRSWVFYLNVLAKKVDTAFIETLGSNSFVGRNTEDVDDSHCQAWLKDGPLSG